MALAWVHKYRFVYRDLKPENILVANDGRPACVGDAAPPAPLARQARSASLDHLKARAEPTQPGARPQQQFGGSPWRQELASGR